MKKHAITRIALLIGITLLAGPGVMPAAQATPGEVAMNFHGTLVSPPPCTISEGNQIDVDFGNIGIKKINGVNYRQKLNYRITCEKGSTAWALKLSLGGNPTDFDKEALMSNRGVGIRMYQNNKSFTPNSTIAIRLDNPPELEVVPVKDPTYTLEKGPFVARTTLRADYQ
ncbi:fimbrial protein [Serratia sp. 1D1416]|uniref:fimbrial protein n=1 Tax=Serratia sp. 1D1416 TaxID=2447890 RepID=UPI001F5DFE67|nr:fimbrial protein [Serratia sp. 1D1416]